MAETDYDARLRVEYYLRYLAVFYGGAVVVAGGAEEEEHGLAGGRLVHHLLQPFRAVVGVRALNENEVHEPFSLNKHSISGRVLMCLTI